MGNFNYISQSKVVELWCMAQGLKDHLTTRFEDVTTDKTEWMKVDALLCNLLWRLIDPSLHPIYTNSTTYCELWTQAKTLYTNDIQCLYLVMSNLINLRQQGLTLLDFLSQMASIKVEYNSLLLAGKTATEDLAQRDKFFIVCILVAIGPELAPVHDQILANPTVPMMDDVYSHLLLVSSVPTVTASSTSDNSVMISQVQSSGEQRGDRGGIGVNAPSVTTSTSGGILRNSVYKLHGCPPRANAAHVDGSRFESFDGHPPNSLLLTGANYIKCLKYKISQQSSSIVASIAHSDDSIACLARSSSLELWVLDLGASNHISDNPHLFSHFTSSVSLPSVTLANGSKAVAKIVGIAKPLPSLPLSFSLSF